MKIKLKTLTSIGAIVLFSASSFADNPIIGAPAWSTPARGDVQPKNLDLAKQTLANSKQAYSQAEIDNKFSAPDWFPEQHTLMPKIVSSGRQPKVWACASCHLTSGHGHPESATLAGLTATYINSQMQAFASGARLDYSGHMNRMAAELSEQEILAVSRWFASLTVKRFIKVKETERVPRTFIDETRMRRLVANSGSTELLGNRIIEVAENREKVSKRDPWAKFISYVPVGSLERGKALVSSGAGKTIACASCHGVGLKGSAIGPALAGNFATYTVRQLHGFKGGTRKGAQSALMQSVVAQLSDHDIVDIAAYLSSLDPAAE
ncbi:MAG: cytochrome c family protein [Osedax symbiont Rs1]|nr:MAG: cytochrome c family protein [Osedax symbiont Rs1]